eukprot:gene9387-11123_t
MSSSMEVGMMPTSDTSRYTDDANSEAIEEVEDEIPELISGFPAEVRENDAEGESDQEDDEEQHLSSRQLFGLARSAPPGSLGHLNNSYELNAQGGRRVAFRGGREVFLDSDEGTDEYDAYVGEEFEGELDEDGNLIPHSDDYEVSNAYHHLRFYGGLLGHDIDDGDEDGDDCREVSDVDEDDYAPDLLSDQEADEIADCISDDVRAFLLVLLAFCVLVYCFFDKGEIATMMETIWDTEAVLTLPRIQSMANFTELSRIELTDTITTHARVRSPIFVEGKRVISLPKIYSAVR